MTKELEIIQNPIIPGQEDNKQEEIENKVAEEETTKKKSLFTIVSDDSSTTTLSLPNEYAEPEPKRKYTRKKKNENPSTELVHKDESSVQVEDVSTMYSYEETTTMTRETIAQLNVLAAEMKNELDVARASKTMRNRYNYIVGISGNLAQILATKLTAIREINNNITKSNELDYKKAKDMKLLDNTQNDDKYLMDLYNAFISNPAGAGNNVLGPSGINSTVIGSPIVRASTSNNSDMMDSGYLNYLSNMTPEQKMMRLEQDPNVQQVVVYDASNGNKFFQVMNIATGEVVTGVPVRDMMFMEDTTIDLKNRIARNTNLNESYPLIVINDNISSEY